MSRWKAKTKTRESVDVAYCCQCNGVAQNGVSLHVHPSDGLLYCLICLELHNGNQKIVETENESSNGAKSVSLGTVKQFADLTTIEAPEVIESAATKSGQFPSTDIGVPSSTKIMDRYTRFVGQLAELQSKYFTERSDEATEQQQQELELLQVMYHEAVRILSANDGQHLLVVQLELPIAADTDGNTFLAVDTPEGEVPVGSVQQAPPLVLTCGLPGGYPLEAAGSPVFHLEAEHLGAEILFDIESTLLEISKDHQGGPILYDWASALQDKLVLPRRHVIPQSDSGEAMEIALRVLAYDRVKRDERRCLETQRCPVCFDEMLGSRGLFLSCGHFGCRSCLEQMVRIHTSEADVGSIRCPADKCNQAFGPDIIRELLGVDSAELARWEELSLQKCLERMQDVVYCPRCDSDNNGKRSPCIEDEDHLATCGVCGFVFCGRCRGIYHPGSECATLDDRMQALEARAVGFGADAASARAELLSLRHLARTTKVCPCCGVAIEKSEGCSKVKCRNCDNYFCWRCGKKVEGYDHFASSECKLFDDDEIRRWNQQARTVDRAQARAHEARFLAQFMDAAQLEAQVRPCPRCKAAVVREGRNNHLRCYACLTHFCARCYTVLNKNSLGEHFNRTGVCPQHSD